MMATADLTAGRGIARALHSLPNRSLLACASLAAAVLLAACGGGSGAAEAARSGCAAADSVDMRGAGNLLSITISNTGATARSYNLHGQLRFSGQAGPAGGQSMLVLTDGQSPVYAGTIQAAADAQAQGLQPIAAAVLLQPGQAATWNLAHAPYPAPLGWKAMQFTAIELCAE